MCGSNYNSIGVVSATGNLTTVQHYSFTDITPLTTTAWYRIKQIDRNGSYTYSKSIAVTSVTAGASLRLFPNPVQKEDATLMIKLSEKEYVRHAIYDNSGRLITSSFFQLEKGNNSINLPVQKLTKGIYTIKITGTKTNDHLQFIKQ